MLVRQSTARTIVVGPILDSTGAAKTDEVVASLKIHKNGGAAGALDGAATLTHSQTGYYLLALTANDLDTLGCAELTLNSGTNSMPPRALNVITQGAWDKFHTEWSATRGFSGTALPDAAADAAGGLPISDAGGLDLDAKLAATNEVTVARMAALTDWTNGGRLDSIIDAILVDTNELQTNQGNWVTATGFSTHSAADVWSVAARTLTANTNLNDPTSASIADAVWDELIAGHAGVGSTGAALAAAGGSGDPWATVIPGAYGAGTAGYILGTNLDAVLSARTLVAAGYFDPAAHTVARVTLVDTCTTNTDMRGTDGANTTVPDAAGTANTLINALANYGDTNWATATGFSTHDAAAAATAVRSELAVELARIDAAISSRGTGTALDAGGVRSAIGLASANLDTQIGTLATAASITTIDTLLDRIAPILIGTVTGAGTGTEVFVYGGVTATVTVDENGNRSLVAFT